MTASDLTASEIEAPPVGEANYQLSLHIYDTAANDPNRLQAVAKQLDQDVKNGTASGISIDYDTAGKATGITINNQNLYMSDDYSVPGKLASNQIAGEIQNGDMTDALNDGLAISAIYGGDASQAKDAVLDGFSSELGDKLKDPDLTDARKYFAQLQQSSGSDAPDLLAVVQMAKDQSGPGDNIVVETDSQTGAVSAFKINGRDLIEAGPTDQGDAPSGGPLSAGDAPPVDLFSPDRSNIPTDQGPSETPPADPPPVVDSTPGPAQQPVADTPGPAQQPVADTPGPAQQPVADTPDAAQQLTSDTPSGPIQSNGDMAISVQPPGQLTEQDSANRDLFQKAVTQVIDFRNESLPVQKGEGYFQVVTRMHGNWSDSDIMEETHRLKAINNFSDELRVGQRLSLISDEEKAELVRSRLDAFDKATPDQRSQMIAEAQKQADRCVVEPDN